MFKLPFPEPGLWHAYFAKSPQVILAMHHSSYSCHALTPGLQRVLHVFSSTVCQISNWGEMSCIFFQQSVIHHVATENLLSELSFVVACPFCFCKHNQRKLILKGFDLKDKMIVLSCRILGTQTILVASFISKCCYCELWPIIIESQYWFLISAGFQHISKQSFSLCLFF